ncbi:hypothetical protein [Caryophanon tenue]|uniref:Uncharacterized protein n=1 Tax=Caryophanon tenue TaxID=33978 RepID=A0A1C0YBP4_9BACL|nr:hypothetical protein [Caryophanon tenue]OCS84606.1 hypothetical protein A6M13_03245 [Caryophanon tenue]
MRQYLGIIAIIMLLGTYLVLELLVGKQIAHLWVWIMVVGYLAAAIVTCYSESGFWKKASATILIALPLGVIVMLCSFMFGISGF